MKSNTSLKHWLHLTSVLGDSSSDIRNNRAFQGTEYIYADLRPFPPVCMQSESFTGQLCKPIYQNSSVLQNNSLTAILFFPVLFLKKKYYPVKMHS